MAGCTQPTTPAGAPAAYEHPPEDKMDVHLFQDADSVWEKANSPSIFHLANVDRKAFFSVFTKPMNILPLFKDLPRLGRHARIVDDEGNILLDRSLEPIHFVIKTFLTQLSKHLKMPAEFETCLVEELDKNLIEELDMQIALKNWFETTRISANSRFFKILRCINQEIVSPGVIELRRTIYSDFPYKDVLGTWHVNVVIGRDSDVSVVHQKEEQSHSSAPDEAFAFTWTYTVQFSPSMENMWAACEISDYWINEVMPEGSRSHLETKFRAFFRLHQQIARFRQSFFRKATSLPTWSHDQTPLPLPLGQLSASLLARPEFTQSFQVAWSSDVCAVPPQSSTSHELSPTHDVLVRSRLARILSDLYEHLEGGDPPFTSSAVYALEDVTSELGEATIWASEFASIVASVSPHGRFARLLALLRVEVQAMAAARLIAELQPHVSAPLVSLPTRTRATLIAIRGGHDHAYTLTITSIVEAPPQWFEWALDIKLDAEMRRFATTLSICDWEATVDAGAAAEDGGAALAAAMAPMIVPTSLFVARRRRCPFDPATFFASKDPIMDALVIIVNRRVVYESAGPVDAIGAVRAMAMHLEGGDYLPMIQLIDEAATSTDPDFVQNYLVSFASDPSFAYTVFYGALGIIATLPTLLAPTRRALTKLTPGMLWKPLKIAVKLVLEGEARPSHATPSAAARPNPPLLRVAIYITESAKEGGMVPPPIGAIGSPATGSVANILAATSNSAFETSSSGGAAAAATTTSINNARVPMPSELCRPPFVAVSNGEAATSAVPRATASSIMAARPPSPAPTAIACTLTHKTTFELRPDPDHPIHAVRVAISQIRWADRALSPALDAVLSAKLGVYAFLWRARSVDALAAAVLQAAPVATVRNREGRTHYEPDAHCVRAEQVLGLLSALIELFAAPEDGAVLREGLRRSIATAKADLQAGLHDWILTALAHVYSGWRRANEMGAVPAFSSPDALLNGMLADPARAPAADLFKVLVLLGQQVTNAGVMRLRASVHDALPYKTLRGSWRLIVQYAGPRTAVVVHLKQEQNPHPEDQPKLFIFEWRYAIHATFVTDAYRIRGWVHRVSFCSETGAATRASALAFLGPYVVDASGSYRNTITLVSASDAIDLVAAAFAAGTSQVQHPVHGSVNVPALLRQLGVKLTAVGMPLLMLHHEKEAEVGG